MDVGDTALDASAASQEAEHVAAAPASEAAAEQTTTTPTAATEQNAATPKAAAEQTTAIPTAAAEQTAATPKAYMIINKKHMYIYTCRSTLKHTYNGAAGCKTRGRT